MPLTCRFSLFVLLTLFVLADCHSGHEQLQSRRRKPRMTRRRRRSAAEPTLSKRMGSLENKMGTLRAEVQELKDLLEKGGGDGPDPKPLRPDIQACEDKNQRDRCSFAPPGEKGKKFGICQKGRKGDGVCDDSSCMWCKDVPFGGPDPGPRPDPPGPEPTAKPPVNAVDAVTACSGKWSADECQFGKKTGRIERGRDVLEKSGRCHHIGSGPICGDDRACVWCKQDSDPVPQRADIQSCVGKKETSDCLYVQPGNGGYVGTDKKCGVCRQGGHFSNGEVLWCRSNRQTRDSPDGC